jgi:hypothetical protein
MVMALGEEEGEKVSILKYSEQFQKSSQSSQSIQSTFESLCSFYLLIGTTFLANARPCTPRITRCISVAAMLLVASCILSLNPTNIKRCVGACAGVTSTTVSTNLPDKKKNICE